MSRNAAQEVERALAALESLRKRDRRPDHHHARDLLLALGGLLAEAGRDACAALLERARALAGPDWDQALRTELSLACAEFARCVEPRYLGLPDYDLAYTRGARSRLEDRLRAARELGVDLSPREAALLALADRVLAAHLEKASSRPPSGPSIDPGSRPRDTGDTLPATEDANRGGD